MESWNFFFSDETSTSSPAFGISEILRASLISPDSSSLSFADDDQSASRAFDSNNNNNRESSSLIALNLGTAVDRRRLSQVRSPSSSSSTATKRARTSRGRYSQTTPFCQVLGCNMDLSGSKEYHKKHRVCDVHSKSPKVVVNGIEQRFCQQCSRFHLLGEFDDGKRSCRRRLAGHNERRRKPPQFEQGLSNKPHKFFSHCFQGSRYLGASQQKRTPFVFSDILPEANLSPEKHEHVSRIGEIKFEADPDFRLHHLTSPVTHSLEKHHRAFGIPSPESQDYYFGSAAMFHKPLGASFDPPCALSLLSSQPQDLSSHFATGTAFVPQISRARQVERHGPNGNFHSSPGTDLLAEPLAFPNSSHVPAAEFGVVSDRAFHGSNYGSTVDLLQLSTHLHRVEHQRNFMQLKQENDEFCCFPNA